MQRNQVTTAGELSIGDTFYKQSDKSKKVFEIVAGKVKQTQYATYGVNARRCGSKHAESMKNNTAVVFLRNISGNIPINENIG